MLIWFAEMETRNFTFTAVGLSEQQAREGLRRAWDEHVRQHGGGDTGLFDDLADEVQFMIGEPGASWRDGEPVPRPADCSHPIEARAVDATVGGIAHCRQCGRYVYVDTNMTARPVGREAICRKCGEAFNPADEDDLIHLVRASDETECGGQGDMVGGWF